MPRVPTTICAGYSMRQSEDTMHIRLKANTNNPSVASFKSVYYRTGIDVDIAPNVPAKIVTLRDIAVPLARQRSCTAAVETKTPERLRCARDA